MIALILSLNNYLTLTRVSLKGKTMDMPHWIILKKSQIVRNIR